MLISFSAAERMTVANPTEPQIPAMMSEKLTQLVEPSQTRAVAHAIQQLAAHGMDGRTPLGELVAKLEAWLDANGLDALDPYHRPGHHPGDFARPRALDVALAMNRLRSARFVRP